MEQPGVATTKDAKFWRQQVSLAEERRRRYEPWWEANLKAYAPSIQTDPYAYGTDIHTNRTFTLVERKGADLFYRRPDVTLTPNPLLDGPILDPMTGQPLQGPPDGQGQPTTIPQGQALTAHQEIVNEALGENGVDVSELMDAVLFDVVCTQAIGFTKLGYESFTAPVEHVNPVTDQPVTAPVPVAERCYWEHFSGKQALVPANWRSTDWDKAPWLGMRFTLPLTAGNREKYRLPPDFQGTKPDGRQYYDHGETNTEGEFVFTGVEIEYRSILFREDVRHPDHLTQLILVDGLDEPVIERDSPHQTIAPDGSLTADSVIGFTIHPFSVRKLTDSAFPPSDATMIRPLENELDVFRTQSVQFRDAAILRYIANGDVLPPDALSKIVRSPIGGITVVPAEAFVGDGAIKPLEGGTLPRENFQAAAQIDADLAQTISIDAQGAGVQSDQSATATRDQIVSANMNARLDKERSKMLKRYIQGVNKFSALKQRYLSVKDAALIVGPQRAQVWDAWRKTAKAAVTFTAMPDAALRLDQAADRKQAQDLYSYLANDPYIAKGRAKLLERLLRKFNIDPDGIVAPPDPPKPQPPGLSFAFKGEDLVGPQAPIVLEIMQQNGIQISPTAVTQSQQLLASAEQMARDQAMEHAAAKGETAHGGKLPPAESLDKHAAQLTGGMQGTGAPAPLGAAGGHLQ